MRTIFLLAATCRLFGESIDGAPLLRQVAAAIRGAEQIHFESVTETELNSEMRRSWQKSVEVLARNGPARLRYEVFDTSGSYVIATDGTTLWRAAPDTREFMRTAVSGPVLEMKGGGPLAEMGLRRTQLAINYLASRLTDQLARAEEIGKEKVEVGARTVECVVVRAEYAPRGGSMGIDAWTQTYWIDRSRLLVLKMENVSRGHQFPDRPFDETVSRRITRYTVASMNELVPETLFTYTAPANYREMDQLMRAWPRPAKEMIGKEAPDLVLPTLTGDSVRLADLRGKLVLLDFWATWCVPCRAQMPQLAKLYAQWKDKGVVLLGVNDDETPEKAHQFMKENGYSWPSLFDGPGGEARKQFRVSSIPTMILIDRKGKIVAYEVGASDSADAAILAALQSQ